MLCVFVHVERESGHTGRREKEERERKREKEESIALSVCRILANPAKVGQEGDKNKSPRANSTREKNKKSYDGAERRGERESRFLLNAIFGHEES